MRTAHQTTIEIKPTEHQIQTQIINFLKYKSWFVMRLNSGKISVGEGRSRRMIQMNEVGTPDIMAFRRFVRTCDVHSIGTLHLDLLFIEVKRPGNKPTLHQKMKMRELESFGARCLVAHSVEEVEEAIA